jgi:hypothetical protein
MDEIEAGPEDAAPERWAARPFLLAGLGLATGLVLHLILGERQLYDNGLGAVQMALLMGVTLFAAMIGFTIERRLWWASLVFAAVVGVAAGFVTWWNGAPGGWSASEGWRTMSLLLAVAIAAPLFQAARDEGRARTPYPAVHDYAWTNVVLWFACWLFVGIVLMMTWLLASLFQLIKIDLLHDLLMKNWFWRMLVGLAFGAALGLLREHDAVVRLLQRVVATVLAVLAPVLALGLALFLIALPFTGLQALWDATSATTPLLLSCAVGALILANAVIGNRILEERRNPLLRYGAMVLGAVILPLAVLAAVATGLRVFQYGYTPERLWAVVFVGIALLYGAAYLGSLITGRIAWTSRVRPANLALAFFLCGLGLLLATPLVSFNAISTRDQVARLESGRTNAEKFDWRALAFDFGKPGRDALARLGKSPNAAIRAKAIEAAKTENRWDLPDGRRAAREETLEQRMRIFPAGTPLSPDLRKKVVGSYPCGFGDAKCALVFLPSGQEAVLLEEACFQPPAPQPSPSGTPTTNAARAVAVVTRDGDVCRSTLSGRYLLDKGKWIDMDDRETPALSDAEKAAKAAAYRAGQVEIRKVERRQVFVGGVPAGEPFE